MEALINYYNIVESARALTNYYENLDSILSLYRMNYLVAYNKHDFVTASMYLFDRNSAHPPEAYVSDMPRFVLTSSSLRAKIDHQSKAKHYCDKWNTILELAMSTFRQKNQEAYNRL